MNRLTISFSIADMLWRHYTPEKPHAFSGICPDYTSLKVFKLTRLSDGIAVLYLRVFEHRVV
jgi:hypothetical protein